MKFYFSRPENPNSWGKPAKRFWCPRWMRNILFPVLRRFGVHCSEYPIPHVRPGKVQRG